MCVVVTGGAGAGTLGQTGIDARSKCVQHHAQHPAAGSAIDHGQAGTCDPDMMTAEERKRQGVD